jgi:pyruvate/2-oxoglutarate/acetoin dehydrogenase E1 component
MQVECQRAQRYLEEEGISAEVIDPIWLNPLDIDTIANSVRKTGKLCVVDNAWLSCGVGGEIVTQVVEQVQGDCDLLVQRLGFAPVTCPPSPTLENAFYPNARTIASEVYEFVNGDGDWFPEEKKDLAEIEFKGPF